MDISSHHPFIEVSPCLSPWFIVKPPRHQSLVLRHGPKFEWLPAMMVSLYHVYIYLYIYMYMYIYMYIYVYI